MAKPEVQKAAGAAGGNGGAATEPAVEPEVAPRKSLAERMRAEGFKEAQTFGQDGVIYSVEKTNKAVIVGLVYKQQMLAVQSERPFNAYFFRLKKRGKGVNNKGEVVDVEVDQDLIVPENVKLKQQLAPMLNVSDPDHVWLVALEATEQLPLDAGKKMWLFDFARLEKTPRSRRAECLPAANEQHATKQLSESASAFFSEIAAEEGGGRPASQQARA